MVQSLERHEVSTGKKMHQETSLARPGDTRSIIQDYFIKTDLWKKIEDDFLNDCMGCSVEKVIFLQIKNEVILDHFQNIRTRRKLSTPKN